MLDPLNLPGWMVTHWEQNAYDYRLTIRSLAPSATCPHCGHARLARHGVLAPGFRDVPMHGKRVGLIVQRQRYRCLQCRRTFVDAIPGLDDHHRVTERLKIFVAEQVLSRPFTAVATEVGLDEKTIRAVFRAAVQTWDQKRHVVTPTMLGIDEVVLGQPRCVLTNVDAQTLLDMLPNRTYDTVFAYLQQMPQSQRVQWVTMDMWRPYRVAVTRALPQATIVIDKFHVMRMANAALDSVRKQIRTTLSPRERRTLLHDRFLLLKRAQDLAPMDQMVLEAWTKNLPLLGSAYRAKEAFFAIYDSRSRGEAEDRYREWENALPGDLQTAFSPLMTAMNNWRAQILAYFDRPITNAYTESVNNLIRAMQRMGRGYSFEVLRAKMLYTAGMQRSDIPRYGTKPFEPVLSDMMRQHRINGLPTPDRTMVAGRLLGSDLAKLLSLLS